MSTLPCLTLMSSLKTIIWSISSSACFLVPPCCVHRDRRPDPTVSVVPSPRLFCSFFQVFWLFLCFVPAAALMPAPPFAGVYAAVRGSPIPRFAGVHASLRRRSRLSHPAVRGSSRRRSRLSDPAVRGSLRRRSRINQPTVRRRWRRRPRLTLAHRPATESLPAGLPLTQCPPACLWLNARRPASDSSPPDCRWLKLAGLPLTHARWPPLAGKANSPLPQFTPPSAAHRPRRSREITPPSVGKANPPSAAPSSSRGRPTRRPRSLGPPPAVASSSPPVPAVEWSSQPVMVSPAVCGRIWPDCDQGLFKSCFQVCFVPEGSGYPWAAPWIFFGGYKGPGCRGRAEGRGHGHHGPPALASWAPCSTLASVCLFRSGGPVLCMSLCLSCGVSRVPTPPPW